MTSCGHHLHVRHGERDETGSSQSLQLKAHHTLPHTTCPEGRGPAPSTALGTQQVLSRCDSDHLHHSESLMLWLPAPLRVITTGNESVLDCELAGSLQGLAWNGAEVA